MEIPAPVGFLSFISPRVYPSLICRPTLSFIIAFRPSRYPPPPPYPAQDRSLSAMLIWRYIPVFKRCYDNPMRDPRISPPEYKTSWCNILYLKRLGNLKGGYFNVQSMYGYIFSNKIYRLISYLVDNVNIAVWSKVHHEDLNIFARLAVKEIATPAIKHLS